MRRLRARDSPAPAREQRRGCTSGHRLPARRPLPKPGASRAAPHMRLPPRDEAVQRLTVHNVQGCPPAGDGCAVPAREDLMTAANAPRPRRDAAPSGREAFRRQVRSGFRRSLGLTALGTVIPGAGLTQTRSKRLGWAILALVLLVAGSSSATSCCATASPTPRCPSSPAPRCCRRVAVAFVVVGILWCGSIILTAIQTRPTRLDRTRTRTLAALTTVLVFLVAGVDLQGRRVHPHHDRHGQTGLRRRARAPGRAGRRGRRR